MWEVPEKWPACPHHHQIPRWGRATDRGRGEKPSLGQNHFALFPHLLQIEYFCERQLTRANLLMRNVTTNKCSFSICFLFEMLLQIASKCVFPFQVCLSLLSVSFPSKCVFPFQVCPSLLSVSLPSKCVPPLWRRESSVGLVDNFQDGNSETAAALYVQYTSDYP